jgi:NADH:ubiquinone oxidoreductase subunit 4 (subunit M)
MLPLIVGIVWLGLYPKPVLERMEPASRRFLEAAAPGVGPPARASLGADAPAVEAAR